MKRLKFVLFFLLCNFIIGLEAKPKLVHINKFGPCANLKNLSFDFTDLHATNERSGAKLSGSFTLREDITTDINLQIDSIRCLTDGKKCEPFTNNTVGNICGDLKSNLFFGDKIGKMAKPTVKCFPFKAGKYEVEDYFFDGTSITYLPIEGYRWANRFLLFPSGKPAKLKNLLGCLDTEITITIKRARG